jgi:hypothetical protein
MPYTLEERKLKNKIWAIKRKAKRKANHQCLDCANPLEPNSTTLMCVDCRIRHSKHDAIANRKVKLQTFEIYGGAVCACCSETELVFLTLDHINNNGAAERRDTNKVGRHFYRWLKDQGYPPGYQVLCFNCNSGRSLNRGICPHQERLVKVA